MSKVIQTVEELEAVLHWRGKHAQAIRERDALQQRLTAADEANDKAGDDFALLSLEAGQRIELLEGLLREMTSGYRSRDHFMKYAPWTNDNDLRERVADFAYPATEGE